MYAFDVSTCNTIYSCPKTSVWTHQQVNRLKIHFSGWGLILDMYILMVSLMIMCEMSKCWNIEDSNGLRGDLSPMICKIHEGVLSPLISRSLLWYCKLQMTWINSFVHCYRQDFAQTTPIHRSQRSFTEVKVEKLPAFKFMQLISRSFSLPFFRCQWWCCVGSCLPGCRTLLSV